MPYKPLSIDDIAEKTAVLFEKYNVNKVAVFGSCARGEMRRGSDVDILIDTDSLTSGLVFVELKRKLEGILKRKVDLISFNSLDCTDKKNEILSEAKVIYEKGH